MILYIENPIGSTQKLLDLIKESGKAAEYKTNTQKSIAFLYTNNELRERKTKKTISVIIATTTKSYLGIFNQGGKRSVLRKL